MDRGIMGGSELISHRASGEPRPFVMPFCRPECHPGEETSTQALGLNSSGEDFLTAFFTSFS